MIERAGLKDRIHFAFKDVARPKKEIISRSDSLEGAMIRNYFAPRKWEDVDFEFLENYGRRADLSAVMAFFSAESFRYYLPAFLCFLVDFATKYGGVADTLLWKLESNDEVASISGFSLPQIEVVRDFLIYMQQIAPGDDCRARDVAKALNVWRLPE